MTTQTEALKHEINLVLTDPDTNLSHGAKRALDYVLGQLEALAQPEQEPHGYLYKTGKFYHEVEGCNPKTDKRYLPLYTIPPQRKPLTDEEIRKAKHHMVDGAYQYSFMQGVRYAEAAHGIKE